MVLEKLVKNGARFAHAVAKQIPEPVNSKPLMSIRQVNEIIFKHVERQDINKQIIRAPSIAHPPSTSASACIIPLESDPNVRIHYRGKTDVIRFGKILEDLDTFAVWLAYKHNQGNEVEMGNPNHPAFHAVTACVDKISKYQH